MRISDWSSDVCSSDLDKAASQIARIRRLERRVGTALAGAVRRVEILEDGEAFLKVRDNWRFNDLAGRLGHQATHARKLLHLRRSEEHTPELQSLMRLSISAFCWPNKRTPGRGSHSRQTPHRH